MSERIALSTDIQDIARKTVKVVKAKSAKSLNARARARVRRDIKTLFNNGDFLTLEGWEGVG